MRILFLPRYGALAGSSRYMSYDFLPYYESAGIRCDISPLLDDTYLNLSRAQASSISEKTWLLVYVFYLVLIRLRKVLTAWRYDAIVLEKDVLPNTPFLLDAFLFALNSKLIVMYDEPTHNYYASHKSWVVRLFTSRKIERIVNRASHVIAWNPVVRDYALRLNSKVTMVTTGIDLNKYGSRASYELTGTSIRIGWIGSPSGYEYLHMLDNVFRKLNAVYPMELVVISSEPYYMEDVPIDNRVWSVESEVSDLQSLDIGVMPLPDTEWAAGKSGCKMLQYMGVGLPVVVSPVGINKEIIEDGVNGLLATNEDEWFSKLAALFEDSSLREEIGRTGREHIVENNSQVRIAERLLSVIHETVGNQAHH